MKEINSNIDEKLYQQVVDAAYGNASIFIKIKISFLRKRNDDIKNLFEDYRKSAIVIGNLKREKLSDEITERIMDKVKVESSNSFLSEIYTVFIQKPAFYSSIAVVLTGFIIFSLFNQNRIDYEGYSENQVVEARADVEKSLAIISSVFADTKHTITNEILKEKVGNPISKSVQTVNNLLRKGE